MKRLNRDAAAIGYLAQHDIRVLDQSDGWNSAGADFDQPWFVNAVILAETELTAAAALAALHRIEKQFGRGTSVTRRAFWILIWWIMAAW